MAIEPITTKPWEDTDPERIAKFVKGIPDETSDKWTAQPDIDACWRGDYRDWHIEDGKSYQSQLYCRFWEDFINPSGWGCEVCKRHMIINWQSSNMREAFAGLVAAKGKEYAANILVRAVEMNQLSEREALELADEFDLETADISGSA